MAKAINRTDRLGAKQIQGTGTTLAYDQNGRGARQISCPSCHGNTISPQRNAAGQVVYHCTCGANFRVRAM